MSDSVFIPAFIGGWIGFSVFLATRYKSWVVRVGGGFCLTGFSAAVIGIVMIQSGMVETGRDQRIQACATAIATLDRSKVDPLCASLSNADQDAAAKLATERDGLIVFLPPYRR